MLNDYIDAEDAERCGSWDRIEAAARRTTCDECWTESATVCPLDYVKRQLCPSCHAAQLMRWEDGERAARYVEYAERQERDANEERAYYDDTFGRGGWVER